MAFLRLKDYVRIMIHYIPKQKIQVEDQAFQGAEEDLGLQHVLFQVSVIHPCGVGYIRPNIQR